jgi:hypothetical protein
MKKSRLARKWEIPMAVAKDQIIDNNEIKKGEQRLILGKKKACKMKVLPRTSMKTNRIQI